MINLNDPFTGLMVGLILIIAFGAYIAFFTEIEKPKHKKENR